MVAERQDGSMKIIIVNHYAYGPDQSAGLRHYWIARRLTERGHDVTIITSSFYHKGRIESRITGKEKTRFDTLDGVQFVWVKTPSYRNSLLLRLWSMIVFSWRTALFLPKKLPRPDVIVGSSPHLFAPLSAWFYARRAKAAFIFEIRDIWPESIVELGGISNFNPLVIVLRLCNSFALRTADRIISVLPNIAPLLTERGIDAAKLHIVQNGIDLNDVGPRTPPPERSDLTFVYAGAHGLYNGLNSIVKAAGILEKRGVDGFRIILIGDGPHKAKLVQMAREMGLKRLEFRDAIPKTKIYSELAKADCFIMLLKGSPVFRWGISPNKLWDYFALGRPIIYAVNAGNDPVSANNAGITIEPDNPEALASAVEAMISLTPEERKQMGLRAREYAERNHAMEIIAARFESACKEAVADRLGLGAKSNV